MIFPPTRSPGARADLRLTRARVGDRRGPVPAGARAITAAPGSRRGTNRIGISQLANTISVAERRAA